MEWKNNFKKGKQLVLATSSINGSPNANIVISLGFIDDKLLVADCQMNVTIKNLKENSRICVVGGHFRIKGSVEIFSTGKYFDLCNANADGYRARNAIVITIKGVFDLDKTEQINLK